MILLDVKILYNIFKSKIIRLFWKGSFCMSFSFLLLFSLLGYLFAMFGIVLGFNLLASMFSTEQSVPKRDNRTNETKELISDDLFSDLDDLADNDFFEDDSAFLQTETNAANEPISYIDIKKCLSDENSIEIYRKNEDKAYAVLQKKIKI